MTSSIQSNSGTSGTTGYTAGSASTNTVTGVDKNMFLQLLVAQLRNQDPLNPSDGTQFVAQLAQFEQLEQAINMGENITAMRTDLDQILTATTNAASQA